MFSAIRKLARNGFREMTDVRKPKLSHNGVHFNLLTQTIGEDAW
jgi:hypothetical protein